MNQGLVSRLKDATTAPLFSLDNSVFNAKLHQVYECHSFCMMVILNDKVTSFKCRLRGLDGAELRSCDPVEQALALVARDRVRVLIDQQITTIRCGAFDKHGCVLVQVTLQDGRDLAELLLREQLAVPHTESKRNINWLELQDKRNQVLVSQLNEATKTTAPLFSLDKGVYTAKLYQVYDCDSFYMMIFLNDKLTSFKCRLCGLDGAEMRSRDPVEHELALAARDRVRALIDQQITTVHCSAFDKYGRVLVQVTLQDGRDLTELLLLEQLAVPYFGGTKNVNWPELQKKRSAYLAVNFPDRFQTRQLQGVVGNLEKPPLAVNSMLNSRHDA